MFKIIYRAIVDFLLLRERLDTIINWPKVKETHPNPLVRKGQKFFSQFDEDGIISEICRRLKLEKGNFFEIGVGDGSECNTVNLLFKGWRGAWAGNEKLFFNSKEQNLKYLNTFVTMDNISEVLGNVQTFLGEGKSIDLFSLDIDGVDYWIGKEILSTIKPKIVIVEYNSHFEPPIEYITDYKADLVWDRTNRYGASLQAWVNLFEPMGYKLVCCNYTGSNAFFIQNSEMEAFRDVPTDINELFMPPNFKIGYSTGHKLSAEVCEKYS
ncbi:MAG: hypothetical protein ABI721_00630 [Candidatus Dojkabacteria bacterium]